MKTFNVFSKGWGEQLSLPVMATLDESLDDEHIVSDDNGQNVRMGRVAFSVFRLWLDFDGLDPRRAVYPHETN